MLVELKKNTYTLELNYQIINKNDYSKSHADDWFL